MRLEELHRYEEGLTLLRADEAVKKHGTEQKMWIKDEEYHREKIRVNEAELWNFIGGAEARERWSVTKYVRVRRDICASIFRARTSVCATGPLAMSVRRDTDGARWWRGMTRVNPSCSRPRAPVADCELSFASGRLYVPVCQG